MTYETTLDQILVELLVEQLPYPIVNSHIEYIGGKHLFDSSEIADILVVLENSATNMTKVALLQSKRLYPEEKKGISPFMNTGVNLDGYEFSSASEYQAFKHPKQQASIKKFMSVVNKNVFYLFYNPWYIPMQVSIWPLVRFFDIPECGMRVVPAEPVLNQLPSIRGYPSYNHIKTIFDSIPSTDKHGYVTEEAGWRFENWMADLFLGCKVGRKIKTDDFNNLIAGLREPDTPAIILKIMTDNQEDADRQ